MSDNKNPGTVKIKTGLLFLLFLLSAQISNSQPQWVSGPTATPGVITVDVTFTLNQAGKVYYGAYPYYTTQVFSSAQVKLFGLWGAGGSSDHGVFNYTTPGTPATITVSGFPANRMVTIYIVAEGPTGTLQANPIVLYPVTLPCPPIKLFTYFGSMGECVNSVTGATGMYQVGTVAGPTGPLPTGVLKGTTFTVNWGDGSTWSYTASADGDLPPTQYHTFTSVDSCAYQGSWVVKNPCNEFLSNTGIFVVHGRDIESDGDGDIIMEEIITGVRNRIRLCEGTEHRVTLADVSQWNCQSPEVPFPLDPADYDNDKPRTIQFIYGETPTGTVGNNNTISGDVLIGPSNIADGTGGFIGSVIGPLNPANPNTQSEVITIPATARAGEQFVVYLKNWNKCNPYVSPNLDYVYDDFVIEIIAAPPAPQPTEPPEYCEGSVPTRITVTRSHPQGIIRWYSNESLTNLLYTGTSYRHNRTAPGTYNYWVTETSGQNGCVSPATHITLIIRPEIENNSIGTAQSICYNTDPANLTGSLPTGGINSYAYQWERSTTSSTSGFSAAPGTSTLRNYDIPGPLTQTTWYRRVVISGPCRDVSNVIRVLVYADLNPGTVTSAQTICYNTAPATLTTGTAPSGGTGSYTYQWEVSTNGTSWNTISGATQSSYSPPALTANRYYRRIVTSGSCGSEPTPAILITVMPVVTPGSIGSNQAVCYNTAPAQLTTVTAPSGGSGTYSYLWQRSTDNSTWDDITSATGASYTPPALTTETYFRRRVISAGCTPVYSNPVLITINPLPEPVISGDVSPCFGTQRGYTTPSVTNHSYSWTVFNGVIVGSSTGNSVTVRWNVAPGPAWVRVTERNDITNCQATTPSYPVTVNPEAPGAAGPISGPANICFGEQNVTFSIAAIANATTYVWTLPAGVTLVSGGGTRTIDVNFGTSVVSPAVISVYASNGCGQGAPSTISVNIYGQLNGGSIGSSQTICYGENVPAFTSLNAASGGSGSFSYRWQMTTDASAVAGGPGWTDVPGGNGITLDYGTLTATTRFVRRSINATCNTPVYSNIITVTVHPQLSGGDINSNQTICYGADAAAFTSGGPATGGSNSFTYTWQYTTNMTAALGDAAWLDINAHGLAYDHGTLTTTTRFVRKAVDAFCPTPVYSDILTVTVRPELSGGSIRSDQTICYGDDVARFDNVTSASGGGGSFTYSWFYTTNLLAAPGDAAWIPIASTNSTSYNHGTLTTTTKFIRRAVDGTCSTPVYSNEVIVTVRPETDGGEIEEDITICYGDDVPAFTSAEDASGGSNSFTYTWFRTTSMTAVPGGPGWNQINSSNSPVYDHGTLTQTTRFVRRAVDAACTDPVYSNVVTVTVRPQLSGGAITAGQTICYGDDVAAFQSNAPASGGGGSFTYTWQYTTDMTAALGDPAWTDINPSNSLTYNHGTLIETTRFVRKAVDATCNTPVYSNILTVTVRPPLSGGVIADDQEICYNADADAFTSTIAASGGSGNFTYTWQYTTDMSAVAGDGTWININGSNSVTYDPGSLTTDTRFIRMAVDEVCSSPVYSNDVKVTVRPQATGGVIASAQTVCPGGDVAAFTSTNDASGASGSFTYTWYYTTDPLALPGTAEWVPVPSSDSPVYDHGTVTQTTRFVRMAVDAICSGPLYSNIVQVTVLPAVNGGVIGTSVSVCYGSDVPAFTDEVSASGGTESFTYLWQYTTNMTAVAGDGNWIDINDSNSASYDHGTLEQPTKFVRRATDAFCTNPVWSNEVIVGIYPLPVTSDITGKSVMCEDDNDQIYRVDAAVGSSWFWTVPASMTIVSPQGFNVIIVRIDGPSAPGDMITVTETNTVTGCVGDPVFFPVKILPVVPQENVSGPTDVCLGDGGIIFSVPDNPGSTYTWFVPAGASITSDPKLHEIEVTFNMALTGQVSCIETSNSVCTTVHLPAEVTVHSLPLAYNLTAQSYYCSGSSGVTVTLSNSQTGVNYQLFRNGIAEGPVVTGTGSSLTWPGMEEGVYHVNAVLAVHPFCEITMNGNPVVEEVPPIVINSVTATDPLCHDGSDGTIVINATGGYPPVSTLTYSIDGGLNFVASNTFSNVGAGSYNIVVQDLRGCTAVYGPVIVNEPDPLLVSLSVTGTIDCYGSDDGAARVVATGGTPGYTYQWYYDSFMINPIAGATADEVQNLTAGTWYVRVTDSNGCQATGQVTISQPPQISGSASVTAMISCYEDNDGEITVTATGGSGNLEYELNGDNNWISSGIFTGLAAGSYTIRVRDAVNNTCIISLPALTVTQPPELIVSLVSKTDVFCFGGSGGSISINSSGGTIPAGGYLYEWSGTDYLGNTFSSTQKNLTGLRAGTYSVTVTDANGCQTVVADIIISQPPELVISLDDVTNVLCFNGSTGEIQITVSGGVMPSEGYYFTWTGTTFQGMTFNSFVEDLTALKAGTYSLTVRDANGCSAVLPPVTITQPVELTVVTESITNVECFDEATGAIDITVTGGTVPAGGYLFSWTGTDYSGNAFTGNTEDIEDMKAGTYMLTVTDANNCSVTLPAFNITQPTALNVSVISQADVFCYGGSGGSISINTAGGTMPAGGYLYEWSGTDYLGNTFSSTQKNLTGLKAGTYSVRVTDANSCQAILADIIVSQPPELVISLDDITNVLCFNESTGEIQITVSGGVMPSEGYYFTWTGTTFQGMTFNSFVEDLSALKAGTYSLTVRDANGCSAVLPPVTITQPVELTVVTESITNVECFDESTGAVDITVTGGTVPAGGYLFSWTGMDYSGNVFTGNTEDLEDMKAGTYMLTITDANNCSVTLPAVNITQPPVLNVSVISQTDVLCFGESTGTISVSVTGGTMPSGGYYYDWTGVDYLGNSFSATTRNLTGITAGTYNLTVTDENGCTASILPVTISMPDALTLDVNVISDYNGRDISCAGASDGRAEAVVTGGTGIYFYTWYSDPLFSVPIGQMGAVAINLAAGDYYVRVMDMNGCSITDVVVLEAPLPLSAAVTSQTNVSCFGDASGAVTVTVTTGTGTEPYVFSKDGGSTWQDNGTFTGLPAMPYTILVRDINNCLISVPVFVTQPIQLMATITGTTNVSCNGGNNGAVTATVSAGSGTAPYEFSINGTDWQSSGTFTDLTAGSYSLMVRDASGCMLTLPVMITEPPVLTLTATPDVVLDCYDDIDGMGTFYATGGTPGYTFTELENSAQATIPAQGYNTQVFFGAGSGTVSFRVTDSKGCIAEASVILTQPSALLPGSIGDNQVLCYGEMPGMIEELSGPSGGPQPADYRYQWQYSITGSEPFISIAGATGRDYTPAEAATGTLYYRRMVTSGFCQPVYSNVVEIVVNPRPIAVLRGGAVICPGESAVLNVDMLAGTGPFEIEIEPGIIIGNYTGGDPIIVTPASTTTYRLVRVTDANNCEVSFPSPNVSGEARVEVSALPSITSFIPSPDVCEFSFAAFSVTATGSNLTYQWWVNDGNGYAMVEDGGTYFGANSNNLLIFTSLREMDGYIYKVVVSGCGIEVESDEAIFSVSTAPELTLHPRDTVICLGQNAIMEADATGDEVAWQWFVNRGTGFAPVTDDGILFSGAETNSLTVINPPFSATPWVFRAIADGKCGVPLYTGFAVMRVINPPVMTRQPEVDPICEGGNIQLNASGTNYTSLQWQVNTGGVWTDITDEVPYLGVNSQQLNIMSVPISYDAYRYRLAFITSCAVVYTDEVALTINANPVVSFTEDPVFACGGEDNILNGNPSGGSGVFTSHRWTGDVGPLSSYVSPTPVFNTLVPGDYYLNYRVQDSNGCTATGDVTVTIDSPSAMFTHDADFGCTPLPVTFEADLDEVVKWWWDFDDGSPLDSISTNPVHVFVNDDPASISYHEVSLRVMSAGGCYATFSSTIMVYPGIDADFSPDRDVICSGETVFFTSTQGASRYYWDFGDNSSGYASNNTSHMFVNHSDGPVTYTVHLTTTSFYNCIDEDTHEITVMPVPIPQFSALPPTQIYNASGNSVTFINETNEGSWTWLWRFGDGSTSAEESPVHNYTTMGEFNVTLLVSNNACSDSVSHIVSVLPPPPVADFDSIPSGCAPLYIRINNTSLNTELPGTTYKWDFADGSQSTAKNPTYTFFTPGSYRIELVVTGPGGTAYKSQVVNVYPSPKAYFEVTPAKVIVNDERVRCFNLSEGASSYVWDFGDGDTSRMKEPYHKYMEEGVYDITLWAYSENGCTDQYVLSPAVTVDPPGVLRFATVFTPNREGPIERTDLPTGGVEIDQFFFPPVRDRVLDYKLQVFNRWGVLIFESHDINVPWNGYYNGTLCQQGVYVWYVEGKYSDGRPYKQVGNVTLLH